MKNVCIVGYGLVAPNHAEAITKTETANLYAVCDINEERINAFKSEYKNTVSYTDFDEMLLDKNIDSVHLCTPHYLHYPMLKKALNAGKTVVCEKPLTISRADFDELSTLEKAEEVCVVFQNRYNPCVDKLKKIVQSGEFGPVKSAKGILTWQRDEAYYSIGDWRGKLATEGGGLLINQAIHTLDYFSYVIGNVKSAKAIMTNFSIPSIEVEDTLSAYMSFENGAKGVLLATNAYKNNPSPIFEITFENHIAQYTNSTLILDGEIIAKDSKPLIGKSYWGNGHEIMVKNYYDNNIFFTPFDAENTMHNLFAIYESARNNGKEITL